jgi:hypothetical protein
VIAKISIATFFTIIHCAVAMADQTGPNGKQFFEEVTKYEIFCKNESNCQGEYQNEVVFSLREQLNKIGIANSEVLKKISIDQAQIWGDTILEGDYVADGQTRLDQASALYKNRELIGYKIKYSEKAWYVGNCEYNGSESSLVDCDAGRIIEVSYVSADLQTFFVDEEQTASFAFDKN